MAEITEVVTKFSFTGSTAPLGDYNKKLTSAIKGLTTFAAATYGSLAGLTIWANSILKSVDPMAQLSRQTGIAVKDIQELGFAASVNGGSLEVMSAGLERLSERIGEAVALGTGEGVEIFKKLGIEVEDANGKAKDAATVFDELRQSIVAMDLDKAQITSIAAKLGLDPSSVQLLLKTNQEMEILRERSRELGQLTQEQADAAAEYNDSLTVMGRAMDGLKQQIAVGFAPEMTKLTKSFTNLIIENRELIKGISTDTINVLTSLANTFGTLVMAAFNVAGSLLDIKGASYALGAGIVYVGRLFFPFTTLIAGIVLVVDDLINAFSGAKSAIGSFYEYLYGRDFSEFIQSLRDIYNLLNSIADFGIHSLLKATNIGGYGDLMAQTEANNRFLAQNPSPTYGGNTSNNINQTNNIEINTNDAREAGRTAADGIQKQMNDAQAQTGAGGL